MTAIENLLANVPNKSTSGSKFESMLDGETRATLEAFVDHLVASGKTVATARSYKSYVAKALALETPWDDMSSDTRSAVRAFGRYMGA